MVSTCISRHMNAPRARVYKSLIDAGAIAKWKVPTGLTCQVHEFETANPALRGEMTITITLSDADSGTNVLAVHDGLPPGLSASDNEAGWRMALDKLADLVEAGSASD
jgi:uncharacterized protein YndB with AHSA1/START domain